MIGYRNASVFPEPVPVDTSVVFPAWLDRIAAS